MAIEVAGGAGRGQQHPYMRAQHHAARRSATADRDWRPPTIRAGVREPQPGAPEGHQSIQRRRFRTQRCGTEHERLLADLLVLVEQHHHQAGPAAEAPEDGAFADAGSRGDVVHSDRVGAAVGDQPPRRIQQQCAVARGVTALVWHGNRQVADRVGGAHKFTVASPEQNGPGSG